MAIVDDFEGAASDLQAAIAAAGEPAITDLWKEFAAIVIAIACVTLAKILDIADEGTLWPVSAFADAVALAFAYYAGMIAEKALQATVSKNRMADASNPSGHANLSRCKLRHDQISN
ncbi:MAG: hypothetical protein M3Z96_04440 [Pseudomonadota bacterium]|nr:hypothetical protein [Pseudomonadota bacterium]